MRASSCRFKHEREGDSRPQAHSCPRMLITEYHNRQDHGLFQNMAWGNGGTEKACAITKGVQRREEMTSRKAMPLKLLCLILILKTYSICRLLPWHAMPLRMIIRTQPLLCLLLTTSSVHGPWLKACPMKRLLSPYMLLCFDTTDISQMSCLHGRRKEAARTLGWQKRRHLTICQQAAGIGKLSWLKNMFHCNAGLASHQFLLGSK